MTPDPLDSAFTVFEDTDARSIRIEVYAASKDVLAPAIYTISVKEIDKFTGFVATTSFKLAVVTETPGEAALDASSNVTE